MLFTTLEVSLAEIDSGTQVYGEWQVATAQQEHTADTRSTFTQSDLSTDSQQLA